MAVNFDAVRFLLWARNLGVSVERIATLGRMGLCCSHRQLRRALLDFGMPAPEPGLTKCFDRPPGGVVYADAFFRLLGARDLVTVDFSDYEGASCLHDLNQPFPENMRETFDLVLDAGTLEHIWNFPAALQHCMELVHVGGHMAIQTPGNNWFGHGFYQFSPELFFRVFSPDNGFVVRKMVVHKHAVSGSVFYEVKDPAVTGTRTELISSGPLMISVLAQRTQVVPLFRQPVQQSDYVSAWEKQDRQPGASPAPPAGGLRRLRQAVAPCWPFWLRYWKDFFLLRLHHGWPNLNNRRRFRRLSWGEVYSERSAPVRAREA